MCVITAKDFSLSLLTHREPINRFLFRTTEDIAQEQLPMKMAISSMKVSQVVEQITQLSG